MKILSFIMELSLGPLIKVVVTIGSMIANFQNFNAEVLFSIGRMPFYDLRVDRDHQPPQRPLKSQIESPVFLAI